MLKLTNVFYFGAKEVPISRISELRKYLQHSTYLPIYLPTTLPIRNIRM